ncbi:ABC transporter ATP-binding protein [Nocardiopsis rhodophaea]|uniref:ABC transporter ATP-binding protein n=1 Tax=Nocardiopsis rhodophaea TaxID=280238 RepID=A0ABN2SZT6_9ACTN
MSDDLVRVVNVSRSFGQVRALDNVSFTVPPGQLIGILGPNGAGKSTLLSLITGIRTADSGTVELFSGDPRVPAQRTRLGCTPQQTGLPPNLRVDEVVTFVGRHYPNPVPGSELLERFGLASLARRKAGAMSGGQQRRLAVALAFVGRPDLVVLDEPTTGMDVEARHQLWDVLRTYRREGGSILLTSHYLEEIEALAERVVVLSGGRVLDDGGPDAIRGKVASRRVSFVAYQPPELPGVVSSRVEGERVDLLCSDSDRVVRELVGSGTAFSDLTVSDTSLEEAFMALTSPRHRLEGER